MNRTDSREDELVDLTNCDREPIHIPGRVQSFGCLVSVTSDWIINHASRNARHFLDLDGKTLVGLPFASLFSDKVIHEIRSRLQMLSGPDAVERLFAVDAVSSGALFDIAVHRSGSSIVLEFEKAEEPSRDYTGYVRPMIDRMGTADTVEQLCDIAAKQIKAITGMDRVMVYRFGPDGSGEVIAEARQPDMEPFLNLHYPASDIPKQARELYKRNLLRIIADVDDAGVEIHPVTDPNGNPVDLSMSTTRAVSPIHLEYLKNMGVGASMSISILRRGELWGLFACHNKQPVVLSYKMRTALELFAQLYSYVLDQKHNDEDQLLAARSSILHDQIMSQLAEGASLAENLESIVAAISAVIPNDGVVSWLNGTFTSIGQTPTREEFMTLIPYLSTTAASQVFATKHLCKNHADAAAYVERAAGLLALPVSRSPRDYIVLFRREIAKSVRWAGNPEKPAQMGPNGNRLTPRESFAAWQQIVRGQCADWTPGDLRTAEALRVTLLEVVLRMADANAKERGRAEKQQELLIAELNHRVRNILNLIKGLINQSSETATDIKSYTTMIGGRIHALARAHDQITRENWAPASLYELIRTESQAYLQAKAERVRISGTDAMLEPSAFTTLSLVFHELMTNSLKYGALSSSRGSVEISLSKPVRNDLLISWVEIGGPPVQAPKRRGFGTTIIERSIPFELGGTAEIKFDVTGLSAVFVVPSANVASYPQYERATADEDDDGAKPSTRLEAVLVVEDNVIIALDAEHIMNELGASSVSISSNVADALAKIEETSFSFVLLDVNLGSETSETVARELISRGVPFAFATGYGETKDLKQKFPDTPIVQKPYDQDQIAKVLSR